jgi:hypothetical protein
MIESLVFLSMIAPRIDGIGSSTNVQSATRFVALCMYVLKRRPLLSVRSHLPVAIAKAESRGPKPCAEHEKRMKKKNCTLTAHEKTMTA